VGVEGASVSEVARRHDVTRQYLYQRRRELRRSQLTATDHPNFVPVEVSDDLAAATALSAAGQDTDHQRVEIVLCNGRILRASTGLSDAMLMRLIRLTEAA
jgi:transposase